MMSFKEFYLQSTKDNKAPPRARRSFKTQKMQDEILDRIAKLNVAKASAWRRLISTIESMSEFAQKAECDPWLQDLKNKRSLL